MIGANVRWIKKKRNYVTQDILRRIAKDYFHYDVIFVMNVTDIDDKIIQRARQQHLLEDLRSKSDQITTELITQVQESLGSYEQNTIKKLLGSDCSLDETLLKASQDPNWKAEMVTKEEKFGMWLEALVDISPLSFHCKLLPASHICSLVP